MGLLADITDEQPARIVRCPVAKAHAALASADRDDLMTALTYRRKYTAGAIASALNKRNLRIDERAIRRHRRGDCACPKG